MNNHLHEKKIVVIIEDQPDIRLLIKMTLDGCGYDIYEASDGKMGLGLIVKLSPDLILLDVMMPGEINGLILCDILKSNNQYEDIPVIFITGADSKEDRASGINAGAFQYIVKPFSPQHLVNLTKRALQIPIQ